MTEPLSWEDYNAQRLSAALAELRARLERAAERSGPTSPTPPAAEQPAPAPEVPVGEAEKVPWALELLAARLGLSPFEQQVLLLSAAMELDTRIPALCARAQGDLQKPFPTLALALSLFEDAAWDVVSPERPLRFFRLIEMQAGPTQPLIASPLRAEERMVSFLKGLGYVDERLLAYCTPLDLITAEELSASQARAVDGLLPSLTRAPVAEGARAVQLLGPDGATKQLFARSAARKLGCAVYRLPVELLPPLPAELDILARLWRRESLLLPLALYLDAQEIDPAATEKIESLARFANRGDGLVFLAVREALTYPAFHDTPRVDIAKPSPEEQQAAWAAALGPESRDAPERLAGQFSLNLPAIAELASRAAAGDGPARGELAWQACCQTERPRLDALAQRIEPKVSWDDLVLPATELALLRQISAQVAQRRKVYGEWGFARKTSRGLGISALFSGASGTGKTMAAEVLAADLKLNLYRIDLSSVVNKYIGETEKNLRRLFDAAEDGGAILFFDEADALFGKRSDVKDSHDRYANIEVNYLLQRIEAYRGLAILATNMKSSLDPAFLRRLRFIVNFPVPGPAERREIWAKVFPKAEPDRNLAGVPIDGLDLDRLAKLNLCGGNIHNIALNAAFVAASNGGAVTMPLILEAARTELQKNNRPVNAADFAWPETSSNEGTRSRSTAGGDA